MQEYLKPTYFIDSDHASVVAYAKRVTEGAGGPVQAAVRLFYAVRDGIRYDPYSIIISKEEFRASRVLERAKAFCVPKAILLAALARAAGVPAALGFADVRNHLTSKRLTETMGTDVFAFHGYTLLYLDGRWLKATATFNKELCEKAGILPLEFDGRNDALFQPLDKEGRRHMEYLKDRGMYADFPYEAWLQAMLEAYPFMATALAQAPQGDFEAEVGKE
jgi:transglutaminase-like putative cysteine protease